MMNFIRAWRRGPLLLLVFSTPWLSGCFEVSQLHTEAMAVEAERIQVEKDVGAYDQHIAFYRSQIPGESKISPGKDPELEALRGYLIRIEDELVDVKVNLAASNSYLKLLRDESAREHKLQSAE